MIIWLFLKSFCAEKWKSGAPAADRVLIEVVARTDGSVDLREVETVRLDERRRWRRLEDDGLLRRGGAGGGEERDDGEQAFHCAANHRAARPGRGSGRGHGLGITARERARLPSTSTVLRTGRAACALPVS